MAVSNTEVFFKKYGSGVIRINPETDDLAKLFPYVADSGQAGEDYNESVETKLEGGVTFNRDGSMFTLNAAIPAIIKRATVGVAEMALRGNVSYGEVAQSKNPGRAVLNAVDGKLAGLARTANLYRELTTGYGAGTASTAICVLGVVNASVSGADVGTPQVVNITRASWNNQMWLNMDGHLVDIYQADLATVRVAGVTVSAPSETTNRLTLTKAGSTVTVAATDVILMPGALAKQCAGAQAILENATSLFGIDAATVPVWRAATHAVSGQMTVAHIRAMGVKLGRKGLKKGAVMLCGGEAFGDLCNELENDQSVNDDRPGRIMGPDKIQVRTNAGVFDVRTWDYMKQGIAWVFGKDAECGRYGAGEVSADLSKIKNAMEVPVADAAGYEFRMYGQSSPLIKKPAHCGQFTGIQSSTDTSPS